MISELKKGQWIYRNLLNHYDREYWICKIEQINNQDSNDYNNVMLSPFITISPGALGNFYVHFYTRHFSQQTLQSDFKVFHRVNDNMSRSIIKGIFNGKI